MQNFKLFIRYILFSASILFFAITSANAAVLWDNAEPNYNGAWQLDASLTDDFYLYSGATVGSIDVWLVTTVNPPASVFDNLFVNFNASTTNTTIDSYVIEDLNMDLTASDPLTGTTWNNVASYRVSIDIADLALGIGYHSLQIGLDPNDPNSGWMWSSVDASNPLPGINPPTLDGAGVPIPPEALAFVLYDTNGEEMKGGVAVVPIPAAFWLFGTALIGFVGMSRKTKKVS